MTDLGWLEKEIGKKEMLCFPSLPFPLKKKVNLEVEEKKTPNHWFYQELKSSSHLFLVQFERWLDRTLTESPKWEIRNSKAAKSRLSFEAFPFVPGSAGFVQVCHPYWGEKKKKKKNH